MDRKMQVMGVVLAMQFVLCGVSLADQNFRQRNIFNHLSDWTATLGKTPEEKSRIVNERVDKRAAVREADAAEKAKAKEAAAAAHTEEKAAASTAEGKEQPKDAASAIPAAAEPASGASPEPDAEAQRDAIRRTYGKHMDDLRFEYRNDPAALKERLKEAEEARDAKLQELDEQLKGEKESRNTDEPAS